MSFLDAILLGIIEGLTELLPVSSTGHLVLLGEMLGQHDEGAKAFEFVIQLGAVIAVAVYFRDKLRVTIKGLFSKSDDSMRLLGALVAAFVPTAIAGLLLHKLAREALYARVPIAGALIAGGVVMIAIERWRAPDVGESGIDRVTVGRGFIIGVCQCLSIWPGTSRSMTTIVGGKLLGLDTKTAAEFSFLLAVPTIGAATVYDFYKNGHHIMAMSEGAGLLAVGMAVSFLVTWLVIAVFLRYVSRVGLTPFGIYRLLLGGAVLYWATV